MGNCLEKEREEEGPETIGDEMGDEITLLEKV